jgi:hypothetical protein
LGTFQLDRWIKDFTLFILLQSIRLTVRYQPAVASPQSGKYLGRHSSVATCRRIVGYGLLATSC